MRSRRCPARAGAIRSALGGGRRHTGLGLAIVAQQVALHDGDLRLEDSPLGGLRVRVGLPVTFAAGAPAT